jgi:hypothetical protein
MRSATGICVAIGEAAAAHALITGGSGVAMGLPENFRHAPVCCRTGPIPVRCRRCPVPRRCWPDRAHVRRWGRSASRASTCRCSNSIRLHCRRCGVGDGAIDVGVGRLGAAPIVIAASAPPDKVAAVQQTLGRDAAGALIEDAMARIAAALVARGVRHLVVAGGETSGAVVSRLGVRSLRIGGEIDPGVPWTYAEGGDAPLLLALKSGNFGARDFFLKAFDAPGDVGREGGFGLNMRAERQVGPCRRVGPVGDTHDRDRNAPSAGGLAASLYARGYSVGSAGNISVRWPTAI